MKAKALIAAVLAAFLFGAGWMVQGWRAEAKLYDVKREYAEATAKAQAEALERYQSMERQKDEAIEAHAALAAKNAAAADAAARAADSLRRDLSGVSARIAAATDSAVREYATTASVVLGECSAEVVELASKADGHSSDVRLMLDAWPR